MSQETNQMREDRRSFLKLAGLGGLAAGAAALAAGAPEPAQASEAGPATAGYRETAHVRKFYETARF